MPGQLLRPVPVLRRKPQPKTNSSQPWEIQRLLQQSCIAPQNLIIIQGGPLRLCRPTLTPNRQKEEYLHSQLQVFATLGCRKSLQLLDTGSEGKNKNYWWAAINSSRAVQAISAYVPIFLGKSHRDLTRTIKSFGLSGTIQMPAWCSGRAEKIHTASDERKKRRSWRVK